MLDKVKKGVENDLDAIRLDQDKINFSHSRASKV